MQISGSYCSTHLITVTPKYSGSGCHSMSMCPAEELAEAGREQSPLATAAAAAAVESQLTVEDPPPPKSPDIPIVPLRDGWRSCASLVSPPLQGSPPHALDVQPVGSMYDTPSTVFSQTTNTVDSLSFVRTASTDSQGQSTVATCSHGDIPFIATPRPSLTALGLEPMASGYKPSAGPFQVA